MRLSWRIRELMAVRGIRSSAELRRHMLAARDDHTGLSAAQVHRLVDERPDRLNWETLEVLCQTLDVTPAELLTEDIVGVPRRVLDTLLVDAAVATAHHELCNGVGNRSTDSSLSAHPGDPFGRVLAWLWRSGRHLDATRLVVDFLAEMRQHNPNAPAEGRRLRWEQLRRGIPMAIIPRDLPGEQVAAMLDHLDRDVPALYGASTEHLNQP